MPAVVTPLGPPRIVVSAFAPLTPRPVVTVGRRVFVTASVPNRTGRVAMKQIGRVGPMNPEMVMEQGARIVVVVALAIRKATLRASQAAIVEVVGRAPVVGRAVPAMGTEDERKGDRPDREPRAHRPSAAGFSGGGEAGRQQHQTGSDRGEGLFAHPSAPLLWPFSPRCVPALVYFARSSEIGHFPPLQPESRPGFETLRPRRRTNFNVIVP